MFRYLFLSLFVFFVVPGVSSAEQLALEPINNIQDGRITIRRPLASPLRSPDECSLDTARKLFNSYIKADSLLSGLKYEEVYSTKIQNETTERFFLQLEFDQSATVSKHQLTVERTRLKGVFACEPEGGVTLRKIDADLYEGGELARIIPLKGYKELYLEDARRSLSASDVDSLLVKKTVRVEEGKAIEVLTARADDKSGKLIEYTAPATRKESSVTAQGMDTFGYVRGMGTRSGPFTGEATDSLDLHWAGFYYESDWTLAGSAGYGGAFFDQAEGQDQVRYAFSTSWGGEYQSEYLTVETNGGTLCVVETGGGYSGPDEYGNCHIERNGNEDLTLVQIHFNPDGTNQDEVDQINATYHGGRAYKKAFDTLESQDEVNFEHVSVLTDVSEVGPCNARFESGTNVLKFGGAGVGLLNNQAVECYSTAYDTIIYHEMGHAADYFAGPTGPNGREIIDDGEAGLSEGLGDVFASLISEQPLIAQDLINGDVEDNWVRRVDTDHLYFHKSQIGTGGRDIYDYGVVWASFGWDLAQRVGFERAWSWMVGSMALNALDIPEAIEDLYIFAEGESRCDLALAQMNHNIPLPVGETTHGCGNYPFNRSFEDDSGTIDYWPNSHQDNTIPEDNLPDGWVYGEDGSMLVPHEELPRISGDVSFVTHIERGRWGDTTVWFAQHVPVGPGQRYHVGAWVKTHLLQGSATLLLEKAKYDPDLDKIVSYDEPLNLSSAIDQRTTGGAHGEWPDWVMEDVEWEYLSFYVTIPNDGQVEYLMIRGQLGQEFVTSGDFPNGWAYWDAFTVTRMTQGGGCFAEGTQITMADGTTKPIEKIKVGDVVQSSTEDGRVVPNKVLNIMPHKQKRQMLKVTTATGASFTVTPEHRVFSAGEYKEIGKLKTGAPLSRLADGKLVADSIARMEDGGTVDIVYNFEVDVAHTYFAAGYLVHNRKPDQTEHTEFPEDPFD